MSSQVDAVGPICENTPANRDEIDFMLKMHMYRKKLQNTLNLYKPPKP